MQLDAADIEELDELRSSKSAAHSAEPKREVRPTSLDLDKVIEATKSDTSAEQPEAKTGPTPPVVSTRTAEPSVVPGKSIARAVGVDTAFIDGLADGLLEPVPEKLDFSKIAPDSEDRRPTAPVPTKMPGLAAPIVAKAAEDEKNSAAASQTMGSAEGSATAASAATSLTTARASTPAWVKPAIGAAAVLVLFLTAVGMISTFWTDADDEDEQGRPLAAGVVDDPSDAERSRSGQSGEAHDEAHPGAERSDRAAAGEQAEDGREADDALAAGGSAAPTEQGETDSSDIVAIETEDESAAEQGGSRSSPRSLPAGQQSAERAKEDLLSAKELLERAKQAYAAGNGREAYRLATKSHRKKPSTEALEVKTLAACQMRNKETAKLSFKRLPVGKERRDVRAKCRDKHGVRLGL
jgi:hypothetical protein